MNGTEVGIPITKKPRAKRGTAIYPHRDSDHRRKYLREYMRRRRAMQLATTTR